MSPYASIYSPLYQEREREREISPSTASKQKERERERKREREYTSHRRGKDRCLLASSFNGLSMSDGQEQNKCVLRIGSDLVPIRIHLLPTVSICIFVRRRWGNSKVKASLGSVHERKEEQHSKRKTISIILLLSAMNNILKITDKHIHCLHWYRTESTDALSLR